MHPQVGAQGDYAISSSFTVQDFFFITIHMPAV